MKDLKNLEIEPKAKSPLVDFNSRSGELLLSGRSIPENATDVYQPLLDWVSEYKKIAKQTTNFRLNLEYFNTASAIWIFKIVKELTRIEIPESTLILHLYFGIEEFDTMDIEDIKDSLANIIDIFDSRSVSTGIKLYGVDEEGKVLKESMVLL